MPIARRRWSSVTAGPCHGLVTDGVKVQRWCTGRRSLVGMGCRRGVPREHLEDLLFTAFERHNLSLKSIKCIATADIKRDEPGILELAHRYSVPVVCYGQTLELGLCGKDGKRRSAKMKEVQFRYG